MTQLPPRQPPDPQAFRVDYADPGLNRNTNGIGREVVRSFAGIGIGVLFGIILVFTGILTYLAVVLTIEKKSPILLAVVAAALWYKIVHGILKWRPWTSVGFLLGMLIGVGLILLGVGMCFANFHI